MKKLILAAIAATMISGGAHACDLSKFGPQNVFNKVELTDKDKCWLDNHATKAYGIDGSVFWIKINGTYYSTTLTALTSNGKSIKENIKDWIGTEISVDLAEAQVQSDLDVKLAKAVAKADIKEVTKIITMKESVEVKIIDSGKDKTLAVFTTDGEYDISAEKGKSYNKGYNSAMSNMSSSKESNASLYYNESDGFEISTGGEFYIGHNLNNVWDSLSVAVKADIEQAVSDAYNQGYSDGYADGYAQGFADGVASVK